MPSLAPSFNHALDGSRCETAFERHGVHKPLAITRGKYMKEYSVLLHIYTSTGVYLNVYTSDSIHIQGIRSQSSE